MPAALLALVLSSLPPAVLAAAPVVASLALGCVLARLSLEVALHAVGASRAGAERSARADRFAPPKSEFERLPRPCRRK